MKKHANLSIFVPHMGCPCRCSFCDQNSISSTQQPPTPQQISTLCSTYLPKAGDAENVEIAFFGGSFTAIDKDYMCRLLKAAYPFVQAKRAAGIRISTRPDAIDDERLQILKQYGVTAIELGAQSMYDEVLQKNLRGHTAADVVNAAHLIKSYGFSLGLQMMIGLYAEDDYEQSALYTMQRFISLCPDTVRIYPALVLQGTLLAQLWQKKQYVPLTVENAVPIAAKLITQFENAGIRVIRVGLHADTGMESRLLAGPYHPAFKQLCESEIFKDNLFKALLCLPKGSYTVQIPAGQRSTAAGQKNVTLAALAGKGYNIILQETTLLTDRQVKVIQ